MRKSNFPGLFQYQKVSTYLHQGAVIAYPTEAVWGLGCDPWNEEAVAAIYELKQRPLNKGLILVAANQHQLHPFMGPLTDEQQVFLNETWPGPNTWLVPVSTAAPYWIRSRFEKVAVRVSSHYQVKALCESFKGAIVSTSANPASKPPATSLWQVKRYFSKHYSNKHHSKGESLIYLPGSIGDSAKPSTIRDITTGKVIRS